jgi:hypothetical protein
VNQRWFQDFVDHPYYDDYWKQNGFDFEVAYDVSVKLGTSIRGGSRGLGCTDAA